MIKLLTLYILMTASVHYSPEQAEDLAHEVLDTAVYWDHDPILFASLLEQESHWDRRAVSRTGAYDIPQLNPRFFPAKTFPTRFARIFQAGKLLSDYNKLCGGVWRGMAAYRQGGERCIKGGLQVGPATARVFKAHRKWTARWRILQNGATLEAWPDARASLPLSTTPSRPAAPPPPSGRPTPG